MKKIIFIILCVIGVFIIVGQMQGILNLWHKQDVLTQTQKRLQAEKKENQQLKQQLIEVQSPDFIEQTIRNKLFLVKPGEHELLINKNLLQGSNSATKVGHAQEPYWQQWVHLFL